jgi:hypothetical protein
MEQAPLRTYNVFLSHSSRDTWLTSVIAERVKTLGCSTWLDVMSMTGGEDVLRSLKEAIRGADEVIVLVSPQSVESQWVSVEIGMALVLEKRITPILNHVERSNYAPLISLKACDLNDVEKFLIELKERIVRA